MCPAQHDRRPQLRVGEMHDASNALVRRSPGRLPGRLLRRHCRWIGCRTASSGASARALEADRPGASPGAATPGGFGTGGWGGSAGAGWNSAGRRQPGPAAVTWRAAAAPRQAGSTPPVERGVPDSHRRPRSSTCRAQARAGSRGSARAGAPPAPPRRCLARQPLRRPSRASTCAKPARCAATAAGSAAAGPAPRPAPPGCSPAAAVPARLPAPPAGSPGRHAAPRSAGGRWRR